MRAYLCLGIIDPRACQQSANTCMPRSRLQRSCPLTPFSGDMYKLPADSYLGSFDVTYPQELASQSSSPNALRVLNQPLEPRPKGRIQFAA